MMNLRDFARGARGLGLLLLVCALGCRKPASGGAAAGEAAAPAKLTLALNWVPEPEFGGFYAAREAGDFKQRGLELEILGGGAGSPVLQMVATGRADFGTVGADELVMGQARGTDVIAVFATYQTSPQGLMAHDARGLKSIEELFRGGTLAIETGLPYGAYLKKKFAWDGVKVVPYDGGLARFLADPTFAQQCYVTSEPLAAKRKGGDPKVFLVADAGYNPYATVIVTRRALYREKPALVRAFVQASQAGWRRYLDDPSATNAVLARLNPAMELASMADAAAAQKSLIETAGTRARGLGSMERARWDTLANQLLELKLIEQRPKTEDLFADLTVGQ
jgi:NitT/TauT family transport system substrate-binding protein